MCIGLVKQVADGIITLPRVQGSTLQGLEVMQQQSVMSEQLAYSAYPLGGLFKDTMQASAGQCCSCRLNLRLI